MCGIIGIYSQRIGVAEQLLDGLKHLEYRGYDSSGIAVLHQQQFNNYRAVGKLDQLEQRLAAQPTLPAQLGIGHTRWATHGRPSIVNAHPIVTRDIALVHNGIVENYRELRQEVVQQGVKLAGETDSEIIAQMLQLALQQHKDPQKALAVTLARLRGAYALAILVRQFPSSFFLARQGSPLVIGCDKTGNDCYVGSDTIALGSLTNRFIFLEDGDWGEVSPQQLQLFTPAGNPVKRQQVVLELGNVKIGKGRYRHFLHKEINEQPQAIVNSIGKFLSPDRQGLALPAPPFSWTRVKRLVLAGCGSSYYACLVAKYWFEELAQLNCEVELASELHQRALHGNKDSVAIFPSQSGETMDTLTAMRYCKQFGFSTAAICNVPNSSLEREVDYSLNTHAGPEISVASTKAFVCQLAVFFLTALAAGVARKRLSARRVAALIGDLYVLPALLSEAKRCEAEIKQVAVALARHNSMFCVGRGNCFPLALEAALKIKELSYIHAEGIAGGEFKHGSIALLEPGFPVIVLAPDGNLTDKMQSNIAEFLARGAQVYCFTSVSGAAEITAGAQALNDATADKQRQLQCICLPAIAPLLAPLLYSLPLHLLAYYTAINKGTDVDQPRNLAKSVTVE